MQPVLRNKLVHAQETQVPPLDDLLDLQNELSSLKSDTKARIKKADEDLIAFEGLYRKARERENDPDKQARFLGGKDGSIRSKERGHGPGPRERHNIPPLSDKRPNLEKEQLDPMVRDKHRPIKREFSKSLPKIIPWYI